MDAIGPGADPSLRGRRVAAVTKTGGWATHAVLAAADVVPVAADIDPAAVEAVLLNGITAWQMLDRKAHVRPGGTVLVHGANGGVGSLLIQLARHGGLRVVGTAAPRNHDFVRGLGAEVADYHDPHLTNRLTTLVPGGFDAVFYNIGGASFERSRSLLARHARLVGYGTASQKDGDPNLTASLAGTLTRFMWWSLTPGDRRTATFYNFWGGRTLNPARFRRHLAEDLSSVLDLVSDGSIQSLVGSRVPLVQAASVLAQAEGRTVRGKIVLVP